MANLSDYELAALAEIAAWKQERGAAVANKVMTHITESAPARWLGERLPRVPATVSQPIVSAITAGLDLLKDGARWTYSDEALLARARNQGLPVERVEQLARCQLEQLDQLARGGLTENKLLAALEGAGTGMGGVALLAADIPALLLLALRTIQQTGAAYGFDMQDPELRPVVLRILGAAAGAGDVASLELAKRLPRDIAKSLARKKLAQWLPLAGAAVGASFNYWFIGATGQAAYMVFRELYLQRKQQNAVPLIYLVPNAPGGDA